MLAAAAGVSLGALPLSTGETIGAVAVFTVIVALTVAVSVVAYLIGGARPDPTLDSTKAWLIANNTAVAVLMLVFGVAVALRHPHRSHHANASVVRPRSSPHHQFPTRP